jgi:hypothetical protein
VHRFVNDLERPVGTYLYGCRMYEVMAPWETDLTLADQSLVMRDFAELGQAADVRLKLELLDERRFGNGVVLLRYATRT